ncbi:hypothetical protein Sango_2711000 [Sesamum angolense]|uniref:MULE transposase domain-containing protein n=1 Tax=Sesamum angolense TaxID=2727404 RepID=A0AAE1W336_9LAMI|nr:hypothetical protein Sango_2711000 [Sesamum angolense]
MYEEVSGRHNILNFYYKVPTDNLERGLMRIKTECPDLCLADLQNVHRGLDTPVVIYVEEEDVGGGAEGEGDVEGVEREKIDRMKGKRKVSEITFNCADILESEFDDSSDSDYVQSIESDDSDAPSLVFEDIEDSSDEDIFLQKNPKKVDGSDPPVFEKLYFSLFAMKSAFLSGCRPLIGLDGCFLKTCFKGQLLVVVGRDGNVNMVPIALAIVPVENRETWTWFVGELWEDIGGLGTNKWSFLSNRQKCLIDALEELVPESEHRYCLRHMYQNFKLKFKSQELKDFFGKLHPLQTKKTLKLSDDVETASEWLKKVPFQH